VKGFLIVLLPSFFPQYFLAPPHAVKKLRLAMQPVDKTCSVILARPLQYVLQGRTQTQQKKFKGR
jgi:hypothetical protein